MATRVMIDGRLVEPEAAKISVFDRGFLYGDSVFETVRTYGGRPFELEAHVARLARSAGRVYIDLPVEPAVLVQEALRAVESAGNLESYIRVMVTRGSGDIGLPPENALGPTRVILVVPFSPPSAESFEDGIRAVTFRTERAVDHTSASGAKVANYLVSVLALREAKKADAEEALIVDHQGSVLEGTTSNVFARVGGQWITPPEEVGILAGLTRARLLQVAKGLSIQVQIRRLDLAELYAAEEAFISSSIRELTPMVSVDGRPIGQGRPGPESVQWLRAFRASVERDMAAQGRHGFP